MPQVTCVLPYLYPEQPLVAQIANVRATSGPSADLLVLNACGGPTPPQGRDQLVLQVRPENLATLCNQACEEARGEFVALLWPHLELLPGALEFLADALLRHPRAPFAYSTYWLGDRLHPLLEEIGDFTEQRDTGWLRLYRRAAVAEIGGWDRQYNHAAEYDLQLRLSLLGESVLVNRPLYRCVAPERAPTYVTVGRSTLTLPGLKEHSVFSYLHYSPDVEREIESAFMRWLVGMGAWLDAPQPGRYDPTHEGQRPLVTVVIPCRNRVRFVRQAVESALAQTYDPIEVLLVDNGSTDGSPESVESLGNERVRVIRNDGQTIASALNRGVREARGTYIAQLDSDDLYVPHTVEAAVACLQTHPGAGLAVSYYKCIDTEGNDHPTLGIVKHLEYSRNNILRCNGAGAVRVWRKGIIDELGGFDEGPLANYGEDYDLLLRVGEHYEVERIHEVLYLYRRHEGNTDAVRDPLDNVRLKTLARRRALRRRLRT